MEVLENEIQQLRAQHANAGQASAKEIEDLKLRLKLYEEALYKFEQSLASARLELDEMKSKEAHAKAAPKPDDTTGKKAAKSSGPVDSFSAAEDAFKKKEWRQAILDYQKYREKNPKGKKYAEATLKIGMSFAEMKMKDEARSFFEEVVAKFPKTSSAKTAAQQLKAIK